MEAATIEVRMARGKLVINATGRTGRGQRYIKATKTLKARGLGDKNFKTEMTAAVEELLGSEA